MASNFTFILPSLSLTLSFSLTHTLTHTLAHSLSHSPKHTTISHSHTLSRSLTLSLPHISTAALHRSEAGRLHSLIRSVKAENREKWTQVKRAFIISKDANLKTVTGLMQESKDREEVLTLLSTELNTYKITI